MTGFIWVLEKKVEEKPTEQNDGSECEEEVVRWAMPVNPESASDIAKISQYMPCLVNRKLGKPFLFKKKAVKYSLI